MITKATLVDCGPLTVEFFNDDAGTTALDTVIFNDDRTTAGAFSFQNLYTEDITKKGVYPIKYRVYHTSYTSNVVTLDAPFVITIVDPCDAPVSVTPSALTNQAYTITDTALPYQFPVYTADPVWCDITYTYTITDVSGDAAVSFNADATVRTFTFSYIADLLLSGAVSTDYTIEVTGTAGNITPTSGSNSFLLTLKNPCIDPAFVTITEAVLLN